jgi:O-antigen biosynthesis protein WbqP
MKRLTDILLIIAMSPLLLPLTIVISLILARSGPILHWSPRIGRNGKIIQMPKFRTMLINTPQVASHLLENPNQFITPIGGLLRKSSLDEIPQLWSILKGDMTLIGPRPALFNEYDLIELRNKYGINTLTPGLTGWAQVNGRDKLTVAEKVEFDREYAAKKSFFFDIYILYKTIQYVILGRSITH